MALTSTQKYTLSASIVVLIAVLGLLYVMDIFKLDGWFARSGRQVGKVVETQKEVRRKISGEFTWNGVNEKEKLYFKDTIYSGSGAQATLDILDNSRIEMGSNTIIVLDRFVLDQLKAEDSQDIQVSLLEGNLRIINDNDKDEAVISGNKKARRLTLQLNDKTDVELAPGDELRLQVKDDKANILMKAPNKKIMVNGVERKLNSKYVVWENIKIKNSQFGQKRSPVNNQNKGSDFNSKAFNDFVTNEEKSINVLAQKAEKENKVQNLMKSSNIDLNGELFENAISLNSEKEYKEVVKVIEKKGDLVALRRKLVKLNKPTNLITLRAKKEHLKQAKQALRVNQYDKAIQLYSKILQSNPNHIEALKGLEAAMSGKKLTELSKAARRKKLREARLALQGADYVGSANIFAGILQRNSKEIQAIEGLRLAALSKPVKKLSAAELKDLRKKIGRAKAKQDYQRAAKDSGYLFYSQGGVSLKELKQLNSYIQAEAMPESVQKLKLEEASNALRAGQISKASHLYAEILRANPKNILALQGLITTTHKSTMYNTQLARAEKAIKDGKYELALPILHNLRQAFPGNKEVNTSYIMAKNGYRKKQQLAEKSIVPEKKAIPSINKQAQLSNEAANNMLNEAHKFLAVGQFSKAEALFTKVLEAQPNNLNAQKGLKAAQNKDNGQDSKVAKQEEKQNAQVALLLSRAKQAEQAGNFTLASQLYSKALSLDPSNAVASSGLNSVKLKSEAKRLPAGKKSLQVPRKLPGDANPSTYFDPTISPAEEREIREKVAREIKLQEYQMECDEIVAINFSDMDANLSKGEAGRVATFIERLEKRHLINEIKVIGHTNNQPVKVKAGLPYKDNYELSVARAQTISSYLKEELPKHNITFEGKGDEYPVLSNKTQEGLVNNRRSEACVIYKKLSCENKVSVNFANLNANLDSAEIQKAKAMIDEIAQGRTVSRLHVIGHADSSPIQGRSRKKFANNLALSRYRAKTFGFLLQQVFPTAFITDEGKGDTVPIANNSTASGRRENRRAETCIEFGGKIRLAAAPKKVVRKPAKDNYLGVQVNLECDCAYNPWVTEITAGGVFLQNTDNPSLTSSGGMNFSILQRYIFNEELRLKQIENMVLGDPSLFNPFDHHRGTFGFFFGADFYERNITFPNGEEDSAASVDFPFGISYQTSLSDQIGLIFDLGLYYSIPLGNYNLIPSTFAETPQDSYGLYFATSAFYQMNLHTSIGLKVSFKQAFENHFGVLNTATVSDSLFQDIAVGISMRYDY